MSTDSGEHSVRSLADILREHGLETELGTRPGRRRRTTDDPGSTGRSPRVDPARGPRPPAPGPPAAAPPAATRAPAPARSPAAAPTPGRSPVAAPSAHARAPVTRYPDPSATGSRPAAGLAGPVTPPRQPAAARPAPNAGAPPLRTGRRTSDVRPAEPAAAQSPATSAIPAAGAAATSHRAAAHPVTGPIPVQRAAVHPAEDDEPLTGLQSALAWARFVAELVVALAVGIGLYLAFTMLWELWPYVALVAAPVAVTGLVAGVGAWRQRSGQGPLGLRLLAVLLLAGTVLVIAPAAGLLAG